MNRWMKVVIAAGAAVALVVAVPSFTSAQKRQADADRAQAQALDKLEKRELEKLSAELGARLAQVHEQIARKMVGLDSRVMRERLALAGEQAKLAVALAGEQAEAGRRAAELAAQQAVIAGQDAYVWHMDGDNEGWLGVNVSEVTAEKAKELKLPAERGVVINDVDSDSAAGKAGLKAGDVVTEFNGQRVEGTAQFRRLIRETPAGRSATLTVWRDGKSQQITVTLGSQRDRVTTLFRERLEPLQSYNFRMPQLEAFASRTPVLGVQIEDVSGQLGAYFGAPDGEGVLVKHVNSGSAAEKAGMKAGDVIVKIDGSRVRDSSEMRSRMRELREKDSVTVSVIRKGAEASLKVELEKAETRVAPRRMRL